MLATTDLIQQRLSVLAPDFLEIEDQSHLHAGHAGAASGGGHFKIRIASAHLTGNRLAQHRQIYGLLHDLMSSRIHALSIDLIAV